MKKTIVSIVLFSTLILFIQSCTHIEVDFSYSPEQPRAGESVSFTNTSTDGDDWEWNFGDGSTSTSKSTSHVYKRAGTYTVRLRLDGKDRYTIARQVVVADTVPTINRNIESVNYYEPVVYSVLIYNPNKLDVSYKWSFSENAQSDSITSGEAVSPTVEVLFTKRKTQEIVELEVTVGENTFNISDTVFVNDVALLSLLYAEKDSNIFRQRILKNGVEAPIDLGVPSGKHPFTMAAHNDNLYIFDAGTEIVYSDSWVGNTDGDGNIRVVNMQTNEAVEIINNFGASSQYGFFNGYVDENYVYWTDYSDFVYKIPATAKGSVFTNDDAKSSSSYYLADVGALGYNLSQGNASGGFCIYDGLYFWAKRGEKDKGIFKFGAADIGITGSEPSAGKILTNYAIRAIATDKINRQIYFSVTAPEENIGLWVAGINGNPARRIENPPMKSAEMYINNIVVDNESGKVYWTYISPENGENPSGIKQSELVKSNSAQPNPVEYFLRVEACAIALDNVKRFAE